MNKRNLSLSSFDNRLMDGLLFCKRVNDWFVQIRERPNGKERLRLRKGQDQSEKKLVEELIPIARYIQSRYSPGRRLKVRWVKGNQQFDACLLSSGGLVDHGFVPMSQCIEVTTVVHENDHLRRKLLNDGVPTFGVKGISLDRKTKTIVSRPYGYTNSEAENDLTQKILERLKGKNSIAYPPDTVLVIQCILDRLFLEDEWNRSIEQARQVGLEHRFREVFLCDPVHNYSATIWNVKRP
jgi:hypothetical protein